MRNVPPPGIFKPAPSRSEAKGDVTSRAARSIIETETARREAKTMRLRAARLEKEAADPEPVPGPSRRSARK